MGLYIGLFFCISLLSVVEMLTGNKKIILVLYVVLALFAGLRYNTGLDFLTYYNFFEGISGFGDIFSGEVDAEIGFNFLVFIFKLTGLNYHTFLIFFSFFVLGLLTIYLYSNFSTPSIFLVYYFARFFFARDMGQIRGAVASIILLYSVKYISEKKIIPFLTVVFLASLFHITSLVFIIGYIFVNYVPKKSSAYIIIMLLFAIAMGSIVQFRNLYIWLIPERYVAYFINPFYIGGSWLLNPVLWMQLLIFFGASLLTPIKKNPKFDLYLKLYFIASLSLIAFGDMSTVGGRLSSPFATFEMFIVPYLFANLTKNKLLNSLLLYTFIFGIFVLIFIVSGNYQFYIPYLNLFIL